VTERIKETIIWGESKDNILSENNLGIRKRTDVETKKRGDSWRLIRSCVGVNKNSTGKTGEREGRDGFAIRNGRVEGFSSIRSGNRKVSLD